MKNKKFISFLILLMILILNLTFVKTIYALACVDLDGDKYIDIDNDGNYSELEWDALFEEYKVTGGGCDSINFMKGAEPTRCDALTITGPNNLISDNQTIAGVKFHPGAIDGPNNGIDEDCDGADGKYIQGGGDSTDITGFFNNLINILGYYVVGGVSVLVLLWGGITYSTAAGDDQKTRKATKAMKGAIIGLIIGIAAPSIINFIIEKVF